MAMWRSGAGRNLSNRRPMTSAPMNNNPMGVQQSMQPVAAPTMNNLAISSPSRGGLLNKGTPSMPNGNDAFQPMTDQSMPSRSGLINLGQSHSPNALGVRIARASDLRQQTSDFKWRMAQSAATPLAPTPSNPFFKPQGRDPQNPSQFAIRNIHPGDGNFVDRGGQTQPRLDTSMARNFMAGQPEGGSANFGQPMNVPGATQTFNGQVVSPPQRYGQEGVIPGAFRGMTPAEGDMHGMSPDAFRVATGGQPMIPYVPSGVQPTDGQASRQRTIANRNARARGVRGSDVAQWRATNPMALMQKEAVANEAIINNSNVAANNWANQGNMVSQPKGQQFNQTPQETPTSVNPFNQVPQVRFDGLQEKDPAEGAARRKQFWRDSANAGRWIGRNTMMLAAPPF